MIVLRPYLPPRRAEVFAYHIRGDVDLKTSGLSGVDVADAGVGANKRTSCIEQYRARIRQQRGHADGTMGKINRDGVSGP